ncbi:MAG TPA: hypothetical protein VKF15_04145 [Nitrososphaerales archaeon]|nr:hypothetical protein [Nitrososphaerales archaeon]
MPKIRVAMYGMTTEGYRLAADLVDRAQVTIVDETLQMAMEVDAAFLRKNPNLGQLMSEEPLLNLKPMEQALSEAQAVFFTPKLRRPSDEALIEANSKLRDLSRYLSKGVTVVNALPAGPGGNAENVMLLEKQTGLAIAKTLNYAYLPLRPRDPKPVVVSSAGVQDSSSLHALGFVENSQNIFSAELEYAALVIESTIGAVTEVELARRAREAKVSLQKASETYVDEFAKYIYDLKAIQGSDETGESISYLAGATIKSLENYVRYIVDETREVLKEKELKASRTKISLTWTLDKYEMRGERLQMAENIQQRLKDYVTDVEVLPGSRVKGGSEALDPLKHNVVIVCSREDSESVKLAKKGRRNVEMTVLLAVPSLRRE